MGTIINDFLPGPRVSAEELTTLPLLTFAEVSPLKNGNLQEESPRILSKLNLTGELNINILALVFLNQSLSFHFSSDFFRSRSTSPKETLNASTKNNNNNGETTDSSQHIVQSSKPGLVQSR